MGSSEPPFRRLTLSALRIVESQHVVSTRKLVDSDEEQELLEQMVDRVKPPMPAGTKHLHYLLSTPFRHPPLSWGSRFGAREERGIWYGARALATAFAEVAYYRFVFVAASRAELVPLVVELSSFRARIGARRAIDLTAPPFERHRATLRSKESTAETQRLGSAMRAAGTDAFLYASARDPSEGQNVGLFTPCFAESKPYELRSWTCTTDRARVSIVERNLLTRSPRRFAFERETFEVEGRLPQPAA